MFCFSHNCLPFSDYTQSQKKCTVESCVSFEEECRYMDFVVYFILPLLLVIMCKNPHSKIFHGSLAILRCLSTCKITKIHPLRKLESCISFFWECSLVKLVSYIISAMFLVISCKKPHFKIPHLFSTVIKCLSASQPRKTVKYEISGNFPLTWSLKFGWLFHVIWYFDMKLFLKHYLEHCRIEKVHSEKKILF